MAASVISTVIPPTAMPPRTKRMSGSELSWSTGCNIGGHSGISYILYAMT